jgi:hypothetical protein
MEIFRNGKSLGVINIPIEFFQVNTQVHLAFNVYPMTQVRINAG